MSKQLDTKNIETLGRELAQKRHAPKVVARELGGQSTRSNIEGWSARARENSRNYFSPDGETRKVRATPGSRGR